MRFPLKIVVVFSLLLLGCPDDPPAPPGSSSLTVSGIGSYEDRPYNETGFTGALVSKPIRQAVVDLVSLSGGVVIATTKTGVDGSYEFKNINNSSRKGGVYVRILAKNTSDSDSPAEVRNSSGALLSVRGADIDDSVGKDFPSTNITATFANGLGYGGAFNILDNFLKGGAFIKNPGFCPANTPTTECVAPFVTAVWQPGGVDGAIYSNHSIAIGGGGGQFGDADEYDDTVILHEYGHFIVDKFSEDTSQGGPHSLIDNDQDIRLSWSEGWATFFASAVLGSPLYIDTNQNGANVNIRLKIHQPSGSQIYTTNEVSVSAVLWDTMNATSSDLLTPIGFAPMWKAFTKIPAPNADTTMESFAVLFMNDNPTEVTTFQTILTERKIELFTDPTEGAETALSVAGGAQHHTLYKTGIDPFGDEDIIPLAVSAGTAYTVKTQTLTNGADTVLTLEGSGFTITANEDNANGIFYTLDCTNTNPPKSTQCPKNNQTTLASKITFTTSMGGTINVRVKRSPSAPLSTGKAGSYDIQLTSP